MPVTSRRRRRQSAILRLRSSSTAVFSLSKAPPLSSSPYNKSARTFVYSTTRQNRVARGPYDYTNTKFPLCRSQQRVFTASRLSFKIPIMWKKKSYALIVPTSSKYQRELMQHYQHQKQFLPCPLLAGDGDGSRLFIN